MGSDDASLGGSGNQNVSIFLILVASTAVVVIIYHCLIIGCHRRRRQTIGLSRLPSLEVVVEIPSLEFSTAQLIPAHKYQKEAAEVGNDTCAICLCEFDEGEELRRLPECRHSYHATCIDMWLYSHASCPMCRMDATPSPLITFPARTYGDDATEEAGDQEISDSGGRGGWDGGGSGLESNDGEEEELEQLPLGILESDPVPDTPSRPSLCSTHPATPNINQASSSQRGFERQPQVASRVATVLVRATVLVSLVLSMAILTTDTTTIQVGINFLVEVKFLDVYSYRYMLGTTVIGAAYMLLQIANTIYRIYKSNQSDSSDRGLLFDFFGDKMVSYFLATGMAAGFGATKDLKATFEGSGSNVDKFFDRGYAAASLLLFSFISTALLSIISSFSLPKNT
ncbi:hypothetical protein MLD38_002630 [Melastoma candidum]|uniref:Uncharacterized protein n=1 Tax=Melastoma candidum TaxID=119954 RepID=A0ACB9RZE4_9MYRT|nr:hypothetical protein MLD38_002630 [Melastoma candidum]